MKSYVKILVKKIYYFKMYFILLLLFVANVYSQNREFCYTPSGDSGNCVRIEECEEILKIVLKPTRTDDELKFLIRSKCQTDNAIMVCCPVSKPSCTTPDGYAGVCMDFYNCGHLVQRYLNNNNNETIEYLRQSVCSSANSNEICCGLNQDPKESTYNLPSTTQPAIINNKEGPCNSQLTAFPPDPSSKCCGLDGSFDNKIIGGTQTNIDQYPWMALIEYDGKRGDYNLLCGGALISSRYVLTAAHCIDSTVVQIVGAPTKIRLGEYDTSNEGKDCVAVEAGGTDCTDGDIRINIESTIPHPMYTPVDFKNDIGLIRLESSAPYTDFIRPICLPSTDSVYNMQNIILSTSGWGTTETKRKSNVKLYVNLPYVNWEECQNVYTQNKLKAKLWDKQICAGGEAGKDSCKGDSGGPLMYQVNQTFEVVGVVSFGPSPCAKNNIPGVYTNVYAYRDWIFTTITD